MNNTIQKLLREENDLYKDLDDIIYINHFSKNEESELRSLISKLITINIELEELSNQ